MANELSKFAKHSIVYGLGNVISLAAGFLLIPLYTSVLTPSQYGMLEIINRSTDVVRIVMLLGLRQAFMRFFLKFDTEEWQKRVTGTTVVVMLVTSIAITLCFLPFSGCLSKLVIGSDASEGRYFILLAVCWMPFEILANIGLGYLQVRMNAKLFVLINVVRLFLTVVLNLILLLQYKQGVAGVLVTNLATTALVAVPFFFFFLKWTHFKIDTVILKGLLRFGIPLLPASFMMFVMTSADRYILNYYVSVESVGIYALAGKIGGIGSTLLAEPFMRVWAPFLFTICKKPEGKNLIGKVVVLFALVSATFGVMISVLAPVILPFITGEKFYPAFGLLPFVCAASVVYNIANIADAGILIAEKTYLKPKMYGIFCVVGTVLTIVLTKEFGLLGAVIAPCFFYLVQYWITRVMSYHYFPFPIDYRRLFLLALAFSISCALSQLGLRQPLDLILSISYAIGWIAIYFVILFAGGFFTGQYAINISFLRDMRLFICK